MTTSIHADDKQAVLNAVKQFYVALNEFFTGELSLMKAVWSHADDVVYMGPAGEISVGWTPVLHDWETQAAMKLGGTIKPDNIHVMMSQDMAIVSNYEKGENTNAKGKTVKVAIRATNSFRKENGQWKMIGHHTDLLPYLEGALE